MTATVGSLPGSHSKIRNGLEVGGRYFKEIRFRFVEETKVRTPGYVAHDVDHGLPHLNGHGSVTPHLALGAACLSALPRR